MRWHAAAQPVDRHEQKKRQPGVFGGRRDYEGHAFGSGWIASQRPRQAKPYAVTLHSRLMHCVA